MGNLFRANPHRCVHATGEIGQEMLSRLTPKIVELGDESREPITLYIDSIGGSVMHARRLLSFLRSPAQGVRDACRIITVVTNIAASAAAVMLCEGDYAVSYPNAVIHFHGIRYQGDLEVTAEVASDMTEKLRLSNHEAAISLANRCFERLTFQYISWRARTGATGFESFLNSLRAECGATKLIKKTEGRTRQYEDLVKTVKTDLMVLSSASETGNQTGAELEAEILRSLISKQLGSRASDDDWTFSDGGLLDLTQDFRLIVEYFSIASAPAFERISSRWVDLLLTDSEKTEIANLTEPELTKAKTSRAAAELRPLWLFEAALCHTLQEDEFRISATDAFRLGLIDEEIGGDSTTLRDLLEPLDSEPKSPEPDHA